LPPKLTDIVPVKLRMREALRRKLERGAQLRGHSANAEAVWRIERTFDQDDQYAVDIKKMEEREAALQEMYRDQVEEQTRKEADLKAALRDTKILNMMIDNQYAGGMLLRSLAREIAHHPDWADNESNRRAFAERMRLIIADNVFTEDEE
jgi:hypothetical protein